MSVFTKAGNFNLNTSTGNQSVTGLGFQPKLLFLTMTAQNSNGVAVDYQFCFSFSNSSSSRRLICNDEVDNVGTTDSGRSWSDTKCLYCYVAGDSTVDWAADLVSLDSDGFTINILNAPGTGWRVSYFAIGGDEITDLYTGTFNMNNSTGDQSITGVGFQPDFVMALSINLDNSSEDYNANAGGMIGMASGPSNQGSSSWISDGGLGTTSPYRYQRSDKFISELYLWGTVDAEATLKSFDSDGFTINITTAPDSGRDQVFFLCVKGGLWHVNHYDSQTSTGNFSITDPGFKPSGLFNISVMNPTSTSVQEDTRLSVGAASSSSERFCVGIMSEYGLSTSNVDQFQHNDSLYSEYDHSQNRTGYIDFVSFNSNGFTLNQVDADSASNEVLYFAVGGLAKGGGLISSGIVKDGLIGGRLIS